jgi:heme O synthase-like polyprenyltransferase
VYLAAASALGLLFIVQGVRLRRDPTPERAIAFFTLSNMYLALLFTAVAADVLIRAR